MKKENGDPLWKNEEDEDKKLWKKKTKANILKSEPPSGSPLWKNDTGELLNEG